MKRIVILILLVIMMCSTASCTKQAEISEVQPEIPMEQEQKQKVELQLEEKKGEGDNSEIFAIQGTNGADKGFERLIEIMKGQGLGFYNTESEPSGLIGKNDVVLLKFNCQWSERGGTNTDLIKSVVKSIIEHPEGFNGEVIIADNGQGQYGDTGRGGSIDWKDNNALDTAQSVSKVAEEFAKDHKVSAMTWDGITKIEVKDYSQGDFEDGFIVMPDKASTGLQISYPKFKTKYGTYVNFKEGIWNEDEKKYEADRLKIINMPVLKSHVNYQVTASIKSYMGTTSDKLTGHGAHNSVAVGGMGTQMAGTRMPVLNVLDAIWINPYPGRGPSTSYKSAVETGVIAASTDPGALDYWSSKYILMETARVMRLNNYETMNPEGTQPGTFGYWLAKSVEELQKAGIKSTVDERRINVYVDDMD